MEPATKRARLLTDHFRVALKPRDLNVPVKKKDIEVVTISDDEDENNKQSQPQTVVTDLITTNNKSNISNHNNSNTNIKQLAGPQPVVIANNNRTQKRNLSTIRENSGVTNNNHSILKCILNSQADNNRNSCCPSQAKPQSQKPAQISQHQQNLNHYLEPPGKHSSIQDYDKSLINNINWEPHYAWDSFQYDREQEIRFRTTKYLNRIEDSDGLDDLEYDLIIQRRAELINWLVDIQLAFVLDHEPLYMAIKLADQYLMRKPQPCENYLLLFMTCILVSSKFDERVPPINISDLIKLARDKFGVKHSRRQIITLEVDLLTTLNFEVRYPLSYGFLRRFARCTRSDMKTLNLARYILESSLMDYDMIEVIESKMAAGSLLLAFEMLDGNQRWDETAKFYSGYDEQELNPLIIRLNDMIHKFSRRKTIIRRKYSSDSFMEVARVPPVMPALLAQTNR